jgi:hypothetical protein
MTRWWCAGIVAVAVGCGGEAEDCTDGADNDGNGRSDCDDAACVAVAACSDPGEPSSGEGEDCADEGGDDEDGDGAVNCEDADCIGTEPCDEVIGFVEIGTIAVDDTWNGTATIGWEHYPAVALMSEEGTFRTPDATLCHVSVEQSGVEHPDAVTCEGCAFAFRVTYTETSAESGDDCATWSLDVGSEPYTLDGNVYGMGYHPTYSYGSSTGPALMFYLPPDDAASPPTPGEWVAASFDVALEAETSLAYAWAWGGWYFY